ncbi:ribonuclease R [Myxococcus stipitatus DSM 14675]|uniref:Ribonuclease R n=1 Tax=Myxococcus stipitatus (strain DSM 14675 / JCM 12634 / Mx s8) TaxID=1278073 RepID=L7U821_MYXSD|nr:ribonuclease R [Myxococcus stipitatus]AGC45046.1 ribonuclease R [Myxococcus stipitatus DSM 14675]
MSISSDLLQQILSDADHPLGIKELLRLAGLHPGQQTELKRTLRELVRDGRVVKEGKRFLFLRPRREGGAPAPSPQSAHPKEAREPRFGGTSFERGRGHFPGRGRAPEARGGRGFDQGRSGGAGSKRRDEWRERSGQQRGGRGGFDGARDTVEGILHVHRDGFGFVHPVSGEGENIFLPPGEAQRALDNDRVVVSFSGRPGRYEGRLLRVVDRRRELAVGVYTPHRHYALVIPTDTSLPGPIRVPYTQMAQEGDLVKVRLGVGADLLDPGKDLFGEVAGSLGKPGTPSPEVLGIAFSQGFSDEFPPEVMDEADRYAVKVSDEEARGEQRKDLRSMPLVTIDGEDARDFDDAVYVEEQGSGWRLVVAIADVTHYVRERSALDAEALRRATSVYLPDRVLPMLPERLSNGICSLRPDEDRLCMVADMTFDAQGQRRGYTLYPAVMRSVARCTYNEVQDVLAGKDVPHRNEFKPHFERMMALARALMKMRKERGAIDFDLPEHKVVLGKDGLPERMDKRERKDSHRLIEECMLAANEAVARFFQDEGLPTVYRFHGEPDPEKLSTFAALAQAYGFKLTIDDGVSSKELDAFISQLSGHPEQRALNQLLLRSMMQAVYTSSKVGHYGLAAEHYLHFTSPIRRYPDLLVHRLLKAHWARQGRKPSVAMLEREEERLEDMAMQCSDRERAAMQVEREVVSFYAALMMKARVGEEFAATVAAITDFGFFVELDVEHVEGLVKAETLGPGSKLDKQTHALVYPNGRRVRVGQKLRVRLLSANPTARKIDFEALQFDGEAPLARREGGAHVRRRHDWREDAAAHGKQRAGRPGRGEREAKKGGPVRTWAAREEPSSPRGRFMREGRREESAPRRSEGEAKQPWSGDKSAKPNREHTGARPAGETHGPKRRMFIRPEPSPEVEASEVAAPAVQESQDFSAPTAWQEPVGGGSSPHPGFDRLRALAAQSPQGGKGNRGAPPRPGAGGKPPSKFSPPKQREEQEAEYAPESWQPSVRAEPPAKPPAREPDAAMRTREDAEPVRSAEVEQPRTPERVASPSVVEVPQAVTSREVTAAPVVEAQTSVPPAEVKQASRAKAKRAAPAKKAAARKSVVKKATTSKAAAVKKKAASKKPAPVKPSKKAKTPATQGKKPKAKPAKVSAPRSEKKPKAKATKTRATGAKARGAKPAARKR